MRLVFWISSEVCCPSAPSITPKVMEGERQQTSEETIRLMSLRSEVDVAMPGTWIQR